MARAVCGDADLADDIAQDSFLRALKGFGGLRPGSNSRSWLARIVHNTCRDHWRSRSKEGSQGWDEDLQAEVESRAEEPDWQPGIIREAFADEIEAALKALPPRWRAAILLVDVEGWSYEESAQSLEIAPGTLRSGLHRARKMLFEQLRDTAPARRRPDRPHDHGEAAT